jgi:hypothetical protein
LAVSAGFEAADVGDVPLVGAEAAAPMENPAADEEVAGVLLAAPGSNPTTNTTAAATTAMAASASRPLTRCSDPMWPNAHVASIAIAAGSV